MEGQAEEDWEDLSKFEVKITVKEKRGSGRASSKSISIPNSINESSTNQDHLQTKAPTPPPKPTRLRASSLPLTSEEAPNIAEALEIKVVEINSITEQHESTTNSDALIKQPEIAFPELQPKSQQEPQVAVPIQEEKILTLADVDSKALELFIPRFFGLKKQLQGLNEFHLRLELQNLFSLLEGRQHFHFLLSFDEKKVIFLQRKTREWLIEKRKKDKLWNAVFEILETERTYVNSLELIVSRFMDPLLADMKHLGISKGEFDSIFNKVREVFTCNKSEVLLPLSEKLKTKGKGRHVSIAEVFIEAATNMTPYYEEYIIALNQSMESLTKIKNKNSKFSNWLDNVHKDPSLNKLKLQDYLLNPIKRISSYPLLLRAVIQYCSPEDVTSRELLEKAVSCMENIAEKQEKETKEKIATIKLLGMKEDIDVPGRIFLREGNFEIVSERRLKNQLIYIFKGGNNISPTHLLDIILCSSDGNFVCTIPLKNAFARDVGDTTYVKNRINIDVDGRIYLLLFKTPLDKELFLKEMPKTSLLRVDEPNNENAIIIREGALNKQSSVRKAWKKRYFVLEEGIILFFNSSPPVSCKVYIYNKEPDARPKLLQLVEYSVSRYPENIKPLSLQFVNETKATVLLSAETAIEQKEWLDDIKAVTARCKIAKQS